MAEDTLPTVRWGGLRAPDGTRRCEEEGTQEVTAYTRKEEGRERGREGQSGKERGNPVAAGQLVADGGVGASK